MKESKTSYAYLIEHMQDPSFQKVWNIASDFVHKLPSELIDELHDSLNRGLDILDSEPLLQMYIYSFGNMHNAKLQHAFSQLQNKIVTEDMIDIVDYGCGQGLATICYNEFIKSHNLNQKINKIILIEPSSLALSRAELLCSRFYPNAEIIAINKTFDDLTADDITVSPEKITLHLFSNILDIESYNLSHLIQVVKDLQYENNEFVIVSPIQNATRTQRLKTFASSLGGRIYYENYLDKRQLNEGKDWTCAVLLCSQLDMIEYDCDKVYEEAKSVIVNDDIKTCCDLFHKLQECANSGDERCQNMMGVWYKGGVQCEQNYQIAVEWFRKSAEQGFAAAQCNLGNCYKFGKGVTQDLTKAVKWYEKSAEQGFASAQFRLGYCYEHGEGMMLDCAKAIEWYRKSAVLGYCRAQCRLGEIYKEGLCGVEKSLQKSFEWYFKAAEQGDSSAQFYVGYFYDNGYGVKKDANLAFEWYTKAAEQNSPAALNNLAICYEYGKGTNIDLEEAAYYYEKSAKLGNVTAQKNLANCYKNGTGVHSDSHKVFYWTLEAAKRGDVDSQRKIALFYFKGYGVARDKKEALIWYAKYYSKDNKINNADDAFRLFQKKANNEDAQALYMIGKCLQYGIPIDKNIENAMECFNKAANLGHIESLIKVGRTSTFHELCSLEEDRDSLEDDFNVTYSRNKKILIAAYYSFDREEEYKIADGTRIICNNAFCHREYLKITIPSSVIEIGENPFFNSEVREIECNSAHFIVSDHALYTKDKKKLISYFGQALKFTIPDGVETIGPKAFAENKNLTEIKFPESLILIEDEAFFNCFSIKKFSLPKNCYQIGIRSFYGCESLQEISSLGSVSVIKNEAFANCDIRELLLPASLTEIGNDVFNSNTKLENVVLSENVTKLGKSCFAFCPIKNVSINVHLHEIGDFCFFQCPIENLKIPSSVKIIGINPFIGTKNIECQENNKFVSENGMLYDKENGTLISIFNESEVALYPPINRVNSFAFYNSNVTDIFMGGNICGIAPWAFYKAKKLERVVWRKSKVKEIPEGCFGECSTLYKIDIPSSVETIKKGAFYNCQNLKIIRFEKQNTIVNEEAFKEIEFDIPHELYYESTNERDIMGCCFEEPNLKIDHEERKIDFSTFEKIEIIVPSGCSKNYNFSTIYNSEYGMNREFSVKEILEK